MLTQKEFKEYANFLNGLHIGNVTVTHNGNNVYLNGKPVFLQTQYSQFITVMVWDFNLQIWERNFRFTDTKDTSTTATTLNKLKNIVRFIETLQLMPVEQYLESTNCPAYKNSKDVNNILNW